MDTIEKLIELLNNSFDKQYSKRGLLTAPHTATDLIANGVTIQKWIPVTDRLPELVTDRVSDAEDVEFSVEISSLVLGIDATGKLSIVRYESGPVFEGWYDDYQRTLKITHWMPLPEPPKE